MYAKKINFHDLDGNEISKTFYFNLTKAEIVEMQLSTTGGFAEKIQRIIDAQEIPEIIKTFKELILVSYGERCDDGKRFIKVKDGHRLADEFAETDAYSELFMELATNADAATNFINGIVPAGLEQTAQVGQLVQPQDHQQKVTPINQ